MSDFRGTQQHDCPGPACQARVPFTKLACVRHWNQVPRDLQNAVYSAWRSGNLERHARAREAAVAAMRPLG